MFRTTASSVKTQRALRGSDLGGLVLGRVMPGQAPQPGGLSLHGREERSPIESYRTGLEGLGGRLRSDVPNDTCVFLNLSLKTGGG